MTPRARQVAPDPARRLGAALDYILSLARDDKSTTGSGATLASSPNPAAVAAQVNTLERKGSLSHE